MNGRKAEEVLRGLDATQQNRLDMYLRNLSTDKDPEVFDNHLRDYLISVSHDGGTRIRRVNAMLDSLKWNQSKYQYSLIKSQFQRFADANVTWFGWNENYKKAKSNFISEVSNWNLLCLRYGRNASIEDCLPRKDTHAGFSYILTGKKRKGEYCEGLLQEYQREVEEARTNGTFNKPILIGSRTQASVPVDPFTGEGLSMSVEEADKLKKSRLVSMIDIYQVLAETTVARPFQQKMADTTWYAGGKADSTINSLIQEQRRRYSSWVTLDYSKYDQSISDWLIRDAFDIVRAAFQEYGWDEELFKIFREDFINKVFITPDGVVESHKGVPSGSMFTQIIDSIVNRLMIDTYMYSIGISDYTMQIMGDDNLIFYNGWLDLFSLATYLERNFGIIMNPDKADFGSHDVDPLFLSRYWTPRGVWRAPEVLIGKMLYPERFREYERKEFHPAMIVQCYIETFPLGMYQFIDTHKHQMLSREEQRTIGDGSWMSGLMAYRKRYSESLR